MKPFEFLEHTADIKIKVSGRTLQDIFENAALAVSSYISAGTPIKPRKGKIIEVKGEDTASLLYSFVDELIYLLDAEHFAVAKASVFLRGNNLRAEVFGDDTTKYQLQHIKAATYADMSIHKIKEHWQAVFVLDV